MDIGHRQGIRLRFDGGLLTGVLTDIHRKPVLAAREAFAGPGLSVQEMTPPYRITTPEGGQALTSTQSLGCGSREVQLTRHGEVSTVVRLRLDMDVPAQWSLEIDAPARQTPGDIAFETTNAILIGVSTTAHHTLQSRRVCIELPTGRTDVTLMIASKPVFAVGNTIVVCRPDQMIEAAIVTSCLPADQFTPIIGVEPLPNYRRGLSRTLRRIPQQSERVDGSAIRHKNRPCRGGSRRPERSRGGPA